jgi:hypothetical protein
MAQGSNEVKVKTHTLVGTWVNGDDYATEVEYQVSQRPHGFVVRAVDRFDGERAEVYDVKWDGEALSFATHWPSTGRLMKCRFLVISPNRIDFAYTYTQQEMWHRKGTEPVAAPNRRPATRGGPRKRRRAGGR